MKICILTHTGAWGGVEIHTLGLAKTLLDRGHEVVIVQLWHDFYDRGKTDLTARVECIHITRPKRFEDVGWWEWRQILASLRADVCIFGKGELDSGSLSLDLAARATFASYITIEHLSCDPMPPKSSRRHFGSLIPGLGLWWYRLLVARHLRSLGPHRILCVSDFTRKKLIEHYRFPARKLTTIHNGFDAFKFKRSVDRRREVRSRWGIAENALVFGALARLSKVKGFDVAIELFRKLTSKYPAREMRLVLVGKGPMEENLRRQASDDGMDNLVIFPGFSEQPWEAYSAFDVFLMPSLNEGLPLALLEAMASGCFPIAMGVGGVPEVITDPAIGWLVPPGDRQGFSRAMEMAIQSNPSVLNEMGQRAAKHVRSGFDAQGLFAQLAKTIEAEYSQATGRLFGSPSPGRAS